MPVILADYGPGNVSGIFIGMFFGLVVTVCVLCAGVMSLIRRREAASRLLSIAGASFLIGAALIILTLIFGSLFDLP